MSWIADYIRIGSYQPPAPTSYEVQRADLDSENTSRNEAGYMNRDRIRSGVYKIVAKWRLTASQLAPFVTAISGVSFSVRFLDLTTASYVTRSMYVGDRSASVVVGDNSASEMLVDFAVNFIEL